MRTAETFLGRDRFKGRSRDLSCSGMFLHVAHSTFRACDESLFVIIIKDFNEETHTCSCLMTCGES